MSCPSSTPQLVTETTDPCEVSRRWALDPRVAEKIVRVCLQFERETGRQCSIISGWRSASKQRCLMGSRPYAATVTRSTHTSCPATGVDISIGFGATRAMKATLGRIAMDTGLRWGGGSRVDDVGIPLDWNHFDLGPRAG